MKKILTSLLIVCFLLLLLTFPSLSLHGAKTGLMLWFETVLPTLLPFMIISSLIMQLNVTDCLTSFFYPVLGKLFGLSKEGCYPFIIGMLSGYPVGAKACTDLIEKNKISKEEGQYLLCFCNNASPMFVISFIGTQCLHMDRNPFLILAIIYGSAILTGILYRILYRKKLSSHANCISAMETATQLKTFQTSPAFAILDQTIVKAFEILVKAGGYIILFSILAETVLRLPFLPATIRYFSIGFLEITTGSAAISLSTFSFAKKTVLTNALTAFGGLSSHAQTFSVIIHSGLSMKKYFIFKCINACIAGICSLLLVYTI
ncbi:hypothetical protein [[Clostridium] polysaccharolyticum]|uniref:Sporulation integral membrane protein YlbJ n=1 Tax=[Clostridium] polysaccharolyticum TaxID=29364 RepID=A0A1I0B1K8_9FIRM|nr:hypothetical protein [[Clostridium] polysaccharolyticum]SES99961.1 sporulation integral membrane protein YlbJ [[Clostridium] polysaccharolyticum]